MRKWLIKKNNHISKSFETNFKMVQKTLKIEQNNEKYKYFERILPKKCCFNENKK